MHFIETIYKNIFKEIQMKRSSKWMTIMSASVIAMGIVGCGGGGDVAAEIPDYAKKVVVDQTVAEKAMSMLNYNGVYSITPKKMTSYEATLPTEDREDSNETENCEYNGTYTTEISYQEDTSTRVYYFNHCLHNYPLGFIKIKTSASTNTRYYHEGSIKYNQTKTSSSDENNTKTEITYNAFVFKTYYNSGDLLIEEREQSGSTFYDNTEKATEDIYIVTENYTNHTKQYDKTSGELVTDKTKVSDHFNASTVAVDNQYTTTYNGYISANYENNSSLNTYLYMKDFVTMYQYDHASGFLHESYNGTVGSSCFGGAIDVETTLQWDGNQSLVEVPSMEEDTATPLIGIMGRVITPYTGETVIKGLDSQVTIRFGQNDENQTYGQFIYEDGTRSDPMRRSDMRSEACGSSGMIAIPVK